MKIIYSTITKTGKRHNNEDSFRIVEYDADAHYMAVVCDGMGGHAMGEVASETVADAIVDYWTAHTYVPDSTEKQWRLSTSAPTLWGTSRWALLW